MTIVDCGGLMTLSRYTLMNQRHVVLEVGDGFATDTDIGLYFEYVIKKKVTYIGMYQ
jgi:hypothetical protein